MTPRGLAKHYMRYWVSHDGMWALASNAPVGLRDAVRGFTPKMAHEATSIIAGGPAEDRALPSLLTWLWHNPAAVAHCDAALKSKTPPKTFAALVEKAYAAELQTIRNQITARLQAELDQY